MKERNISLENDLMMLGQEPMDEPDSSTTIELQEIVKKTERKMLNPPAPPLKFEPKTADKSTENTDETASKTSEKTTSTVNKTAPKAYKPATRKTNKTAPPTLTPTNPYAPVEYDCNGKWRQLLTGIAVIGILVAAIALLVGAKTCWRFIAVGALTAFAMLPLYGWFDELERDMAVKAVEKDYGIRILQTNGGNGLAEVHYMFQQNPTVEAGMVSYGHGLAWLRSVGGKKIVGRRQQVKNDTQHGKAARFPAFFFNGVWQGLKTALVPHACISDPLPPMPTVRDWLQAHGGTGMDADAFDRCESEWYELLEQRKRQMNVFLAGLFVGTLVYAIAALALLALVGWLVYSLVPFDGFGRLVDWVRG